MIKTDRGVSVMKVLRWTLRGVCYTLLFSAVTLSPSCSPQKKEKPRVVFDALMDLNDLIALYLCSRSPEIDVAGVTISGTMNHRFKDAAEDAESILDLAKVTDTTVASLLSPNFCSPEDLPASWIPLVDDINYYNLPKSQMQPVEMEGYKLIEKIALESSKKIDVLCLGPLNNIAYAISSNPRIKSKISRILVLAGSIHTKKISPLPRNLRFKEGSLYNIFLDPCAAEIVFQSGIPITLVTLDICGLVPNTPDLFEKYPLIPANPGAEFTLKVWKSFASYSRNVISFATFWNLILIMGLINSDILSFDDMKVSVLKEPGLDFGMIIPDEEGHTVRICTGIDTNKFYEKVFSMVNE